MTTPAQIAKTLPGFFKADDFPEGEFVDVTISKVGAEEVGQDKEIKTVLAFAESPKKLIVNGSRNDQLTNIFGADTPLEGKKVRLDAGPVKVGNRVMHLVRVNAVD